MKKTIMIGLVVLAMIAAGLVYALPGSDDSDTPDNNTASQQTSTETTEEEGANMQETVAATFTAAQVAEHSTRDDCWTIIEGEVYDVTSFISDHPGGEEILRACGIDATTLFTQRHTENGEPVGSGTPHSSGAEVTLENLKIGSLAE